MMTIDFGRLAKEISQAETDPSVSIHERKINPYLLENVIMPFLNDVEVKMADLNFSAFAQDDIIDAQREIDDVSNGANKTLGIAREIRKSLPIAKKVKQFF